VICLPRFYKVNFVVANFIKNLKKYYFGVEWETYFIIVMFILTFDDFNYFKLIFNC